MIGIWDEWVSREENRHWTLLPPIIPVIFCHARKPWSYPLDFASLVSMPKGLDLALHTPRFSALLVDLAHRDDTQLGKDRLVRALLRILKHIQGRSWDQLAPALKAVHELKLSQRHGDLAKAIITYLFQARHSKSTRDILELLPSEELRREAMTIADRLEKKGRLAGMQAGKREGRIEGEQKVLERLLDQKFGLTEEERKLVRSQLDPERLDAALDAFVFADSKANVLEYLGSTARPKAPPRQDE